MSFKFNNSLQRDSPVVFNLLIINVLVYLAQIMVKPFDVTEWGALHYYKSSLFYPHQFITNMFLHDPNGLTHILFNMFTLWMFGTVLERSLGSKRFLIFYLICGVGAAIFVQLTIPFSAEQYTKSTEAISVAMANGINPSDMAGVYKQQYSMVGASGAIMGVMAAYAYLFPNTEMYIMFIPVPVKAKYVIPFLFLLIYLWVYGKLPGIMWGILRIWVGPLLVFYLFFTGTKPTVKRFIKLTTFFNWCL